MASTKESGSTWKVRIDLPLEQEQHDRVTRAIQSAVLAAVAEIDLASPFAVDLIGPSDRARSLPGGPGVAFKDAETDPFGDPIGDLGVPDGAIMKIPETQLPL